MERDVRARAVAARHGGVAHRRELNAVGVSRADVRTEVSAGRWRRAGRHTVVIVAETPTDCARFGRAVWEAGGGAVLDGAAALVASGMRGFTLDRVDVTLPGNNRHHRQPGVRLHRRRDVGPVIAAGIPRVRPEHAAIHAAQWAVSDRQAALLLCLAIQQRLVSPDRLLTAWEQVTRSPRRVMLDAVIHDLCDGAHSLGELDFARLCRSRGLPTPDRQHVVNLPGGRVYLDVRWSGIGLVVEVDGGHHAAALAPVDDALRQNELVLREERVLRIPVIGLRLSPESFMAQVARAHLAWS